MRITRSTLCRAAALLALLPTALPALGQETDSERWFRVELMIFSHESASAASAERWDPAPPLAYPPQARFLIDNQRIEKNLSRYPDGDSIVDARGVQTITLPTDSPAENIPDIPRQEEPPGALLGDPVEAESEQLPVTPEPFTLRPLSELEFRGKAAYMQRTGRFKTLFHQTWLQPMRDEEQTLPIIIDRSGDEQNWPRLQGSVKLYLSRYLHIETNLWLNTHGDYLPADWFMPAPPLGPESLMIIEPPAPLTDGFFASGREPEQPIDDEGLPLAEETGPVYGWRHAILMDQKRRMRSNEVHYIDHPMLGVVVKLLPLTAEELEDLAIADAQLAESAQSP